MSGALGLLSLVATGALVAGEVRHHDLVRAVSKTVASGAFVAAAFAGGAWAAGTPGRAIVGALVLSMVGDLCLLSRKKAWFLAGLVAFLLGHVGYAVAFLALGVSVTGVALAAGPVIGVAFAVWRWLSGRVGPLAGPVKAYIAVISAMLALAAGSAAADPSPVRIGLLGAAFLFYLSDLCVARDRFVAPGPTNRVVGLPTYYLAQVMFAWLAAAP